jgi:hypothetical protein
MRIRNTAVFMSLVLSFSTIVSVGQVLDQDSNTNLQTISLMARKTDNYDNYTKAAFNFRLGINGDDAVRNPRNEWDLLYGNISLNGDKDWFTVAFGRGDRSRIKELGELTWTDHIEIPVLPACSEEGDCTTVIFPSRLSKKSITDVNPNVVRAATGQMYLVHKKNRDADFYALFRVEALEPSETCTISWKLIPPPKE